MQTCKCERLRSCEHKFDTPGQTSIISCKFGKVGTISPFFHRIFINIPFIKAFNFQNSKRTRLKRFTLSAQSDKA